MKTYYIANEINIGRHYGGGEPETLFLSIEELMLNYVHFFEEEIYWIFDEQNIDMEQYYNEKEELTDKGIEVFKKYIIDHCKPHIVCKELPDFDYYAVQDWCDGFGNDTYTITCFPTYEQADKYNKENENKYKIVGQWWGDTYLTAY